MLRLRAFAAGALALLLAACATPQTDRLRGAPGDLPRASDIADAPFFAQNTRECGPAALAMALVASGRDASPDALVAEVYTPERGGTLPNDMIAGARRHGRLAYTVSDMNAVFREVNAGRPVVVLQNLALQMAPQWHFAVVIGYDLDRGTVTLHSGTTPRHVMAMETFERTWARGDHWGMLVLRPGEVPVSAERFRYVAAATGLERAAGAEAAHAAYEAGLALWPDDFTLRMGHGNTLYGLGRLEAAAAAFERAARDHPGEADAFNNLAHVRLGLGQLDAAEKAARRAVELGGRNAETYRGTLDSVLLEKRKRAA